MFEKRKKTTQRTITSKVSLPQQQSSSRNKILKKQLYQGTNLQTQTKALKSKSQCLSKQRISHPKNTQLIRGQNSSQIISKKPITNLKKSQQKSKYVESLPTDQQKKKTMNTLLYQNSQTQKPAQMKWIRKYSLTKKNNPRSVQKDKLTWNQKKLPLQWQSVLQDYSHFLTKYQLTQIREFNKIFYIGHKAKKKEKIEFYQSGFDNQQKEYNFIPNDHIAYRYQILEILGKGSYGQVFRVYDHKRKEQMALKMIKNRNKFSKQAFIEIKILTYIKQQDPDSISNIVRIKDFIIFRKHVCLVFELLSQNLYELIIRNNYNGLNIELIRRFAIQILTSLCFLGKHKIIHCDLKPENILLREYSKSGIKLIDFGSSCFENQILYTYIQSRYYRAPEITLGCQYDHKIDIWSAGCILGELYTGVPLFPGENQMDQMKYFVDTLGMPPKQMLIKGNRVQLFYTNDHKLKSSIQQLKTIEHFSKKLEQRISDLQFLKFLKGFLKWNPKQRITATQALQSEWIMLGLPQQLRNINLSKNELTQKSRKSKSKSQQKVNKLSQGKIPKIKKL